MEQRAPGDLKISVVMPTLNSERTLRESLESIARQDYEGEVEIIIADGGSNDGTIKIAKEYGCTVISNPGKTGEAGKATGYKVATGDVIALIDSDNILVSDRWFSRAAAPFEDSSIAASEPLFFESRKGDSRLTRYCAMMGFGDPLCYFLNNYDHFNVLSGKWTGLDVAWSDCGDYLEVRLVSGGPIPTMGANGCLIRKSFLDNLDIGDYLFDIDIIGQLVSMGNGHFAKVKIGIVHLYGSGLRTFARKQLRRVRDFNYYKKQDMRTYPWAKQSKLGVIRFVIYTMLIVPLVFQAVRGYRREPDSAWLLHVPACWITLVVYAAGFVEAWLRPREQARDKWHQ